MLHKRGKLSLDTKDMPIFIRTDQSCGLSFQMTKFFSIERDLIGK